MRKLLVLMFLLISVITAVSATKLLLDQQAKAGCNAVYYGDVGLSSAGDHNAICAKYNEDNDFTTVSCDENRYLCTWPPPGHPGIVAENSNFACCCPDSCNAPAPTPTQIPFDTSNCKFKCCVSLKLDSPTLGQVRTVCLNEECPDGFSTEMKCIGFCPYKAYWDNCMAQKPNCPPADDALMEQAYNYAQKCGEEPDSTTDTETGSKGWL